MYICVSWSICVGWRERVLVLLQFLVDLCGLAGKSAGIDTVLGRSVWVGGKECWYCYSSWSIDRL